MYLYTPVLNLFFSCTAARAEEKRFDYGRSAVGQFLSDKVDRSVALFGYVKIVKIPYTVGGSEPG